MKVYFVHCEYYDYDEYAGGSMLLGVYSSMELAISARNDFVAAELADGECHHYIDDDNNPVIDKIFNGEVAESNTYTIEEWTVVNDLSMS